jgi:hypothetical protein
MLLSARHRPPFLPPKRSNQVVAPESPAGRLEPAGLLRSWASRGRKGNAPLSSLTPSSLKSNTHQCGRSTGTVLFLLPARLGNPGDSRPHLIPLKQNLLPSQRRLASQNNWRLASNLEETQFTLLSMELDVSYKHCPCRGGCRNCWGWMSGTKGTIPGTPLEEGSLKEVR